MVYRVAYCHLQRLNEFQPPPTAQNCIRRQGIALAAPSFHLHQPCDLEASTRRTNTPSNPLYDISTKSLTRDPRLWPLPTNITMALPPSSPRLPSPPPQAEIQIGPKSPGLDTPASRQAQQMEQSIADANAKRRIHPGTKAEDMAAGPPLIPLNEVCLPAALFPMRSDGLFTDFTYPRHSLTLLSSSKNTSRPSTTTTPPQTRNLSRVKPPSSWPHLPRGSTAHCGSTSSAASSSRSATA